jgi:uncharacterized membrane protein
VLLARVALAVVALMAAAFAAFFIVDVARLHAAFGTHAEDLGIMDQALWNATNAHGRFLHQTICDTIGDTNCLGDVPRTAIHFEPILLPIALVYTVFPSPLTLVAIQALVVAAGAFPAYWIASRRLGSALAGVAFAALYLAFPALQAAVGADFHAVTLSAAFVLFAFYFMLARQDLGLWVASALAMTTKEEVPLLIVALGLSVAVFQRRWRLGLALAGAAVAYLGLALLVLHLSSPVGHSPTADRYAYLGGSPLKAALFVLTHPLYVLRDVLLAPDRVDYLRKLLAPTGYLALLSPLTLLVALPELLINMLSADPLMRSGAGQYNADIVPVIVVATIESVGLVMAAGAWLGERLPAIRVDWLPPGALTPSPSPVRGRGEDALTPDLSAASKGRERASGWVRLPVGRLALAGAVLLALALGVREERGRGLTPLTAGFHWPQVTAHDQLADRLVAQIPAQASVSAQSDLVPHLSERRFIYLFPDHADAADYVFLDVTGNIFPLQNTPDAYLARVRGLLAGGAYHVVAAQDGYLLLRRGADGSIAPAPGDPYGLPASFYTFAEPAAAAPAHPLDVRFGPSVQLVGYDLSPEGIDNFNIAGLRLTTYWRMTGPLPGGVAPVLMALPPGAPAYALADLPALQWLPAARWPAGAVVAVATRAITPPTGAGTLQFGARVVVTTGLAAGTALPAAIASPFDSTAPYPRIDRASETVVFAGERVIP